ncbi:MAG: S8 family serine peptidase [Bacteroidales bacterium]|nr:S8 family serine peptidase [Bacteroidales bacterium]
MRIKITSAIIFFGILFSLVSFSQTMQKKQDAKYFTMPVNLNVGDYLPKTIIVRVKPEFRGVCENSRIKNENLNDALSDLKVNKLFKKFPNKKPPVESKSKTGQQNIDLSLMYEITYDADISIEDAINELYATSVFEYVELHYIPVLLYTPNDPMASSQYHLNNIHAYEGWDIDKGDTNVVIGIIDTGVDTDHPDLVGNIKYNYEDPIDGVDNDNDGYVDNYRGWDVAMDDNNPEIPVGGERHGIHVSGIAAASTDNGTGVAGVGFKCKFLPVKIAEDIHSALTAAYEGIVYAADHGCSVINCSWGRSGGGISQYEQDIINYAVVNMYALVVVACGNSNNSTYYYPAAYNNVLAVAGTNSADTKWIYSPTFGSSYYDKVDVCAPGDGIYSTMIDGTYSYMNGTSMAAPCVAGCAAIVKSKYPGYTGTQIGELLKATADNIYTIPANIPYTGKLGTGRVNLFRALTETTHKSAAMTSYTITDGNDNIFVSGETLSVEIAITNFLAPLTTATTVTLSTVSSLINYINPSQPMGYFTTGQTKISLPCTFSIKPSAVYNSNIKIYVTFSDGTYTHEDSFMLMFNKDYVDVNINKVATSVSSKGRTGYTDFTHNYGLGFTFNGSLSILNIAGLLVGVPNGSNPRVSDCVYGSSIFIYDNDFTTSTYAHTITPPVKSDFDVLTEYHDTLSGLLNRLMIKVTQNTYAWSDVPDSKYIIFEYYIRNIGTTALNDLYAGLYADWDIVNDFCTKSQNRASYDDINKIGYIYCVNGGYWAGLKMLTTGPVKYYAFDNDGYYGSYQINNGFNGSEKYGAMSGNQRLNAGNGTTGNDVSHVLSSGPYSILPGDTVKVAFAMIVGTNLNDLQVSAQKAVERYAPRNSVKDIGADNLLSFQNFPNPFDGATTIKYQISKPCFVKIKLIDVYGKEVSTLMEKQVLQGEYEFEYDGSKLEEGVYYFRFEIDNKTYTKKVIVIH